MMEYRLHGVVQPVLLSVPGKVCVFDFAVADGLIPPLIGNGPRTP